MFPRNEGDTYRSPFRSPISNVLKTKSLFYEYAGPEAFFSLKDHDLRIIRRDPLTQEVTLDKVFPSLYLLYKEANDITEYDFASTYLESYDHWLKLCKCTWFKQDYLRRWRRDLELKQKATALKQIVKEASSSSKNSFQANKFLFEKNIGLDAQGNFRTKEKGIKVTTNEILDHVKQMESMTEDDYERIIQPDETRLSS